MSTFHVEKFSCAAPDAPDVLAAAGLLRENLWNCTPIELLRETATASAFKVVDDDQMVGVGFLNKEKPFIEPTTVEAAQLSWIAVTNRLKSTPKHTSGLHIGSRLLRAMEADGQAAGVSLIHLLPIGDSVSFYQSHDYHFYGNSGLMIKEL